mmetsp:Transcript_5050/g.9587  ORF Transcript_5050/g.9587 Transcript_5050/m.9587 type:complete len:225 (+) Transcript_5050:2169-2843(+)
MLMSTSHWSGAVRTLGFWRRGRSLRRGCSSSSKKPMSRRNVGSGVSFTTSLSFTTLAPGPNDPPAARRAFSRFCCTCARNEKKREELSCASLGSMASPSMGKTVSMDLLVGAAAAASARLSRSTLASRRSSTSASSRGTGVSMRTLECHLSFIIFSRLLSPWTMPPTPGEGASSRSSSASKRKRAPACATASPARSASTRAAFRGLLGSTWPFAIHSACLNLLT